MVRMRQQRDTEQFLLHDSFLKGINGSVLSPWINYSFSTQGNEPCARKSLQGGSEHPWICRSHIPALQGSRKTQSSPMEGTPGSLRIPGMQLPAGKSPLCAPNPSQPVVFLLLLGVLELRICWSFHKTEISSDLATKNGENYPDEGTWEESLK